MLANSSFTVLLHLAVASTALLLGAIVLARRKGTTTHRRLGRIGSRMLAAAVDSLWIRSSGALSWIHLLSIWTLIVAFWHEETCAIIVAG
ncbi:MAG: hypothetical protein ACJ8LN_06590 [Sulfurifustis sp.]